MATFPAFSVQRVHTKFIGSGKLTFEVNAGAQGLKNVLVSKAKAEDLKAMLMTLDAAAKAAKQRNVKQASQEEVIALLQQRYPQEIKKQLAKLRQQQGSDAPQPMPNHTRLMLVVDANGSSVMQAGRNLCKLVETELKLTSHPRPGESNAQNFKAVCKDPADKSQQVELRVRQAIHHRWPSGALCLDFELGEKIAVPAFRAAVVKAFAGADEQQCFVTQLAHGAIKERLAANLVLHIRSGLVTAEGGATDFGTRLELRWGELDPSAKPLGRCELRYWEEGARMAAPVVTGFELQPEPCKAWGAANGDKTTGVLAASLIARLEVFCLRLAASSTGHASRTRLLVLGWMPQVKMASAFAKRGFAFQGDPDKSLGFKMLRNDEAKRRDDKATAAAVDSPASGVIGGGLPASVTASSSSPDATGVSAAAVTIEPHLAATTASSAAAPIPDDASKVQDVDGTPGLATGVGAAGKRRRPEDNLTPQPPVSAESAGGSSQADAAAAGDAAAASVSEPAVPKPEAIDLGEIGMLGRLPKAAKQEGTTEATEYKPVSISAALAKELGVDATGVGDGGLDMAEGEGDELDATMAELLAQ